MSQSSMLRLSAQLTYPWLRRIRRIQKKLSECGGTVYTEVLETSDNTKCHKSSTLFTRTRRQHNHTELKVCTGCQKKISPKATRCKSKAIEKRCKMLARTNQCSKWPSGLMVEL